MLKAVLLFAVGLILLIKGGDWFVDSAVGIAHRFHIPELIIGATIVSIGTTLPEVMVSATSAVSGHGEIAYGNAVGSVICNTALIAALTAAITPQPIDRNTFRVPVVFFFGAALFYCGVAYTTGYFSRLVGFILIAIFVGYIAYTIYNGKKNPACAEQNDEAETKEQSLARDLIFLVIGAACIAEGADLLVDNGTIIAQQLGVPEAVIALTFVALGTSLPELVTAITSIVKGHGALSLGNIAGANLFNLVLVSGIATALSPFSVPISRTVAGINASLLVDMPVMILVMAILTLPTLKKGRIYRWQGITLLCVYAAFCVFQFVV